MDLISELINLVKINTTISRYADSDSVILMILENSARVARGNTSYLLSVNDKKVDVINSFSIENKSHLPYSSSSAIKAALTKSYDIYTSSKELRNNESILANQINNLISFYLLTKNNEKIIVQVVGNDSVIYKQEHITLINLFSTQAKISLEMSEMNQKIKEKNKAEAYMSIATQVAHDIRSPIELIKSFQNDFHFLPTVSREYIEAGLEKIESIASDLLKTHRSNIQQKELELESIESVISQAFVEKKAEFRKYQDVGLIYNNYLTIDTSINKNDGSKIKRIISNIINNAVEALDTKKGFISITLKNLSDSVSIQISDNGSGIPEPIKDQLFVKGFTTKDEGNGIGLYNAKNELLNMGGDLTFETSEYGTDFIISIPFYNLQNSKPIVLIDDDRFMHISWARKMQALGISFTSYYSIKEFLHDSASHPTSTFVFVDSDLGDLVKGEIASHEIFKKGFENLYLSTGYDVKSFSKPSWIKDIIGKNPSQFMANLALTRTMH